MHTQSELIRQEIQTRFGFVPPFFKPAFNSPAILENLWRQTVSAYIENPIPALFKEKLAAVLGRYCSVPYCLLSHASSLRPLGMTGTQVLALLDKPPGTSDDIDKAAALLQQESSDSWPEADSDAENAVLQLSVAVFLERNAQVCLMALKAALTRENFDYLILYISYNKTCLDWAEAHPELSAQEDDRFKKHFNHLLSQSPALGEFFENLTVRSQSIAIEAREDAQESSRQSRLLEQASRELFTEREKFEAIIDASKNGIGILRTPELVFEKVNEEFKKILGSRSYTKRAWKDVYSDEADQASLLSLSEVFKTGKAYSAQEVKMRIESGPGQFEDRFFDINYDRLHDGEGKPYGILVQTMDVTSRIQTREQLIAAKEEAERANSLKSAFLANMSHEIRTPLGAIIGFTDLLRDQGLTAGERSNYINIMSRNGEQLSTLINDILDLSKVEAGHLSLEYIDTDHKRIGSEVVSLLQVKAREKDLSLEYTSDPSAPAKITTDPSRVRQILLNLVSNAIKFTRFGSVKIKTYGCHTDDGRPSLCFEVSDTGIGITADQQERLFKTFSQADETTTRNFGGTGLGLALSRRLARELGGDITIENSVVNVGTTFLVKIVDQPERRTAPEEAVRIPERPNVSLGTDSLKGIKILVVDDAPDNQQLIWRYLTKQGAIVTSSDNGLLGYRTALSGDFDVVLMDIQMPVMDGYTATQKLREAGYRKPVLALTAHAMNDIRLKALNVGYTDYLTKPINPSDLIHTIAKHASAVN